MSQRLLTLLGTLRRGTRGAVDLSSVLVGVLVVGILSAVVAAATLTVVPWSQDQAANQALNDVRIAESSAHVKQNVYLNEADLIAGKFYSGKALADIDPVNGSCYIAASPLPVRENLLHRLRRQQHPHLGCRRDRTLRESRGTPRPSSRNRRRRQDQLNLSYDATYFDPTQASQTFSPTRDRRERGAPVLRHGRESAHGCGGSHIGPELRCHHRTRLVEAQLRHGIDQLLLELRHRHRNRLVLGAQRHGSDRRRDDNASTPTMAPKQVKGALANLNVTAVSVGDKHVCAIAKGSVYCWGDGANGDLGSGTTSQSTTPQVVAGALMGKTVTAIASGQSFSCAIADGSLYCWGLNTSGQLGIGPGTNSLNPALVGGLLAGKTVTAVTAGQTHACAVANGAAYCWGLGTGGQLGDSFGTSSNVPVAVLTTGVLSGKTVTAIDGGEAHTCAIASGAAYCWGANTYGQLGNGGTAVSNSPVQVVNSTMAGTVTSISAGRYYTCATAMSGGDAVPYCWGYGSYGSLGNGGVTQPTSPMAVTLAAGILQGLNATSVTASDYVTCVAASGAVTCFGKNQYGQLGDAALVVATVAKSPGTILTGTGANNGMPISITVQVKDTLDHVHEDVGCDPHGRHSVAAHILVMTNNDLEANRRKNGEFGNKNQSPAGDVVAAPRVDNRCD